MKNFLFFARIFTGFIFAYAGLSKLLEPVENFAAVLANYPVMPLFLVKPIAFILPWIEWIGGSFLILGYAPRIIAIMLSSVTLVFIVTLVFALSKGHVDCGCFGEGGLHLTRMQILILDVINLIILIRLASLKKFPWSVDAFLKSLKQRKYS